MKSAYNRVFLLTSIVTLVDWLMFNAVLLLCYVLDIWPYVDTHIIVFSDWLIANISYVVAQAFARITLHKRTSTPASVLRNASRAAVLFVIVNAAILGMAHMTVPGFWRSLLVAAMVFAFTSVERLTMRNVIKKFRSTGRNNMRTIIIGYGYMVRKVANVMLDPWNGYKLLGIFAMGGIDEKYKRLGDYGDVMKWLSKNRVDEIYIASAKDDKGLLRSQKSLYGKTQDQNCGDGRHLCDGAI